MFRRVPTQKITMGKSRIKMNNLIQILTILLLTPTAHQCNAESAFERIMRVNSAAAARSRGDRGRDRGRDRGGDLTFTEDNGERVELFEGDIVYTPDVESHLQQQHPGAMRSRDAATSRDWPNGVVPYTIRPGDERSIGHVVREAAGVFSSVFGGCIEWKYFPPQRKGDYQRYVEFFVGRGCFSFIGMARWGSQKISLGYGCWSKGVAIHEMMHTLGFYHEHSRIDRDAYVRILWHNIEAGRERQFRKYYLGAAETLGEPYDVHSIMHYPSKAFSKNGSPTILTRNGGYIRGQRYGLSEIDIRQLKKYYKCQNVDTNKRTNNRNGGRRGGRGGGGGTNTRGRCSDVRSYCSVWSRGGYCNDSRYLRYMKKNCRRSCGWC